MTFAEFSDRVRLSVEDICRDIFYENRHQIKVKKEAVVVKNLVNIYNATLKLSNQKGFHAMSLRDLARETDLSLGALYSYFSGKEQLLGIIQEHGARVSGEMLYTEIKAGRGPEEQLGIAIRTHLYLSEIMQPWFYFFYMETKNLDKKERKKAIASELNTEQLFTDIISQGMEQGCFTAVDPVLTAASIKALLQDWYLKRWKYRGRKVTVDDYAAFVAGLIEKYLKT
ncbi:MAG: TetR/AcrR family transcriptional regulator [Desulfosudaceae bacterium]